MPALTLNNPFVENEFYFENSTNLEYYRTLKLIRRMNSTISFSIGIFLSVLLFFLIYKKSPKQFQSYREVLAFGAIVDSFILVQSYMLQIQSVGVKGENIITFDGPATSIFGPAAFCPFFVFNQGIGAYIGVGILPIQYFCRYYTLTRQRTPPIFLMTIFFFFILVISSLHALDFLWDVCQTEDDPNPKGIDYGPYWFEEVPIPVLLVKRIATTNFLKQFSGNLILIFFYILTLWFSLLSIRELKNKFESLNVNPNIKAMQAQLSRTLLIQGLIPLIVIILPRASLVIITYFGISSKNHGEIIGAIVLWYPVLSLFSTILCIIPYRRYCIRILTCSSRSKDVAPIKFLGNSSKQNHQRLENNIIIQNI